MHAKALSVALLVRLGASARGGAQDRMPPTAPDELTEAQKQAVAVIVTMKADATEAAERFASACAPMAVCVSDRALRGSGGEVRAA